MDCTKCGRKGRPVRIACLKCNATLPGWPTALDTPEERARQREPVICQKCGTAATDGRIACLGCDQTVPESKMICPVCGKSRNLIGCQLMYCPLIHIRQSLLESRNEARKTFAAVRNIPFSLGMGALIGMERLRFEDKPASTTEDPRLANAIWRRSSVLEPGETCAGCRNADGEIIDGPDADLTPVHSGLPCTCLCLPYTNFEQYPTDLSQASRKQWAVACNEALRAQRLRAQQWKGEGEREAPLSRWREANRRRQDLERAALQKSREAHVFEKDGPDEAVLLYREVVGIYENIGRSFSVPPLLPQHTTNWLRLDDVYDRLTVLLSRAGREEEALAEIARYRALGRDSQPASAAWNAMVSREARIKKRLARDKPDTDGGTELR